MTAVVVTAVVVTAVVVTAIAGWQERIIEDDVKHALRTVTSGNFPCHAMSCDRHAKGYHAIGCKGRQRGGTTGRSVHREVTAGWGMMSGGRVCQQAGSQGGTKVSAPTLEIATIEMVS